MLEHVPDNFEMRFKTQRDWGHLTTKGSLVLYSFYIGGIGAGLYSVAALLNYFLAGAIIGFVLVAIGKNVAHLLHSTHRAKFVKSLGNLRTSWISRGTTFDGLFIIFGLLDIAPMMSGLEWLPWANSLVIRGLAILFAMLVMIYVGFVMAQSPAIPLWHTQALPLLFLLYSMAGGLGLALLILQATGVTQKLALLEAGGVWLFISILIAGFTYIFIMKGSTAAARFSVKTLTKGELAPVFLGGAILGGSVVPLVLLTVAYYAGFTSLSFTIIPVAAVLAVIGAFLFMYSIFRAGAFNKLL